MGPRHTRRRSTPSASAYVAGHDPGPPRRRRSGRDLARAARGAGSRRARSGGGARHRRSSPGRRCWASCRRHPGASAWRSPARTASRPRPRCSVTCSSRPGWIRRWRSGRTSVRGAHRSGPVGGAPFLVEADEFGDNFLNYHPAGGDRHQRRDGPSRLLRRRHGGDGLVRAVRPRHGHPSGAERSAPAPGDGRDPGADELAGRLRRLGPAASSATVPGGEVEATDVVRDPAGTRFRLFDRAWEMPLAGEHNVRNATAALLMARDARRGPRVCSRRACARSPEPGGGWS